MTEPIWQDIEIELERLERERGFTERLHREMPAEPPQDAFLAWRDKKALSDAVESLYTGMERIMLLLAEHCDGQAPAGQDWHRRLIDRLAHPARDGARPALLSPATRAMLDDLRAFRHRTRMGYGAELDWHRTRENGERAVQLLERFRGDLFAFGRELQLYDP